MKTKLICISFALFLLTFSNVFSQGFIQGIDNLPSQQCYLILNDGTEIEGKVRTGVLMGGSVRSINIKDVNEEIHKYKAEDIKLMRVKMGTLAKMEAIGEGSESLADMRDLDFDEIVNREYIFYEQALLPKKKDKYALLQLLNPGFDERIKVYQNPTGQETGGMAVGNMQLTGGEEKSYLVVKDGNKSMKVKKGSYKKDFSELYNDCTEMLKVFSKGKPKFDDMATHVLYYNKYCE